MPLPPLPPVPLPTHTPAWQVWLARHAVQEAPQFMLSVCVSTQAPAHNDCPAGQPPVMQALFTQICPLAQATPQPPQWSALLEVMAHMPLHSIAGVTQLSRQLPPTQACTEVHALPQRPQFCASLDVSAVHEPESSPLSFVPSSLEQAAKPDMPKRIEPPSSHVGRKRFFVTSDRMGGPFMMFAKLLAGVQGAAPGPELPNSAR
jgi:hypothetical protein